MKKLLALVLALVMTLSLCVVSSNAAYTDAADVELNEAVDVLSAIGVFQGSDGKFDPKANLTREQAAKLVAYLQIGDKAADALVGGGKFTDVAKDRWSAGYVDYCASIGIAAGVGDSKFDPTGSLTALQFGKMLLVCLGYDAKVEGMVGADWQINTSKLMTSAKLLRGLSAVTANSVVTREQAAQMMLNALRAPMVEYDTKGTTIAVNGATIEFGASKADYVTATVAEDSSVRNIGQGTLTNTGAYTVELGEKLYSNLKRTPLADGDDFGRPAHQWTLKATKIGTYSDTPDLSYTAKTKLGTIYTDLGLGKKIAAEDVTVYVNGVEDATLEKAITKGDTTNKLGGNGVLLEVFYDDDDHSVVITLINTYVGEIVKTVAATASKDAYVVVDTDNVRPAGAANTEEFETDEAFEDEAIVYYTFSVKEDCIESVAVCEKVEGTVSQVVNKKVTDDATNGLTIAGTSYKSSAYIGGDALGSVAVKNDYIAYLDAYGYVILVEESEFVSSDYALVLATADRSDFVGNKAELLFTDGSVKVVDTDKNYHGTIANRKIVTFKVDDNGEYKLKEVTTTVKDEANESFEMKNGKAGITVTAGTVTANSKSVFVVFYADEDENVAYTGIKNAPSIKANGADALSVNAYYYCKSDMVTVMFIAPGADATIEDEAMKSLYVAEASMSDLKHDADGDYYEFNVIANGEITTAKIDATKWDGGNINVMNKSYTVDKYGVVIGKGVYGATYNGSNGSTTALVNGVTGISKTSEDYTVTVGGYTITVAENAKIFYVDKDGKIEEIRYKDIVADDDDLIYAVVDDYMVEFLVIEEDGGVVTPTYYAKTVTGVKFYKTYASSTLSNEITSSANKVEAGTTVYVTGDATHEVLTSEKVTLTEEVAPVAGTAGVYSFKMPAAATGAMVDTGIVAADLVTFQVLTDSDTALVEINGEVVTVNNTTGKTITVKTTDSVTVVVDAVSGANVLDATTASLTTANATLWHTAAQSWKVNAFTGNTVLTINTNAA